MGGLSNTPNIQRTHTYKLPDYGGVISIVGFLIQVRNPILPTI